MRIEELIRLEDEAPAPPRHKHADAPRALPERLANWPEEWKSRFEERAAIMEFHGDLPREEAEELAEADVRKAFSSYAADAVQAGTD